MALKAPARRVAHLTTPGYRAGNSLRGRRWAKANGYKWIDNDMQITKDRVLINCHWPKPRMDKFLPDSDNRTVYEMTWEQVKKLRSPEWYMIRSMRSALKQAADLGLNVEVEAKVGIRVEDYERLASYAREAYGVNWKRYVWIKTLSDIGGYAAASERLRRAHKAGFTTMILLRGKDRFRKVTEPWIDYQRGGLR